MKLVNIILSCVLVMGLATSCGSKDKKAAKEAAATEQAKPADDGWKSFLTALQPQAGEGTIKQLSLQKDGKLLTVHCTALVPEPVRLAEQEVAILSMTKSSAILSFHWNGKFQKEETAEFLFLVRKSPGNRFINPHLKCRFSTTKSILMLLLGVDGNRKAGSLYDLIPANPQNTKPVGEWNQVSILCYQGTVVFKQNGANVVEFHLWTDDWKKMVANSKFKDWPMFVDPAKEGYIGLQDHGNDVWFRNIKIKEM